MTDKKKLNTLINRFGGYRKITDAFKKFKKAVPNKTQNIIILSIFLIISAIFIPGVFEDSSKNQLKEIVPPGEIPGDDYSGERTGPGREGGEQPPDTSPGDQIVSEIPKSPPKSRKSTTVEKKTPTEKESMPGKKANNGAKSMDSIEAKVRESIKVPPAIYLSIFHHQKTKVSENKKSYWGVNFKEYDITMVYIPPGNFTMGQTKEDKKWLIKRLGKDGYNECYKDETPAHDVFLPGYWMGKTEVTNQQYVMFLNDAGIDHRFGCQGKQCIDTNKESRFSHIKWDSGKYIVEAGYGKYPVTDVSWYGAVEYCKWLSKKIGSNFKLPTEAQWEKAARWSDDKKRSFIFPWGDMNPINTFANFNSVKPALVESYDKRTSPYGLRNMAGNVWEWCSDRYLLKSTTEKGSVEYRVRRGGGFNNTESSLHCAGRNGDIPSERYSNVGFRLCMD